jgi:hypothetical protein
MRRTRLAVASTPRRFSCRIYRWTRISSRADFGAFIFRPHTILQGVPRSLIPGYVDAHVLLRKRSALPVPNGWMAAGRLHNDRGRHQGYCFFCYCQPASCVNDLADVLLVSHFELLVPVICSFLAPNRPSHALDVSSRPCLYGLDELQIDSHSTNANHNDLHPFRPPTSSKDMIKRSVLPKAQSVRLIMI